MNVLKKQIEVAGALLDEQTRAREGFKGFCLDSYFYFLSLSLHR